MKTTNTTLRKWTKPTLAALVAVLLAAVPAPARAICDQSGASTSDQNLWNLHGCWQAFFLWEYQAYDMTGSDWAGRGWNDACNVSREFPKHWNAAYLVTYGMGDNNSFSFHGTADYRAAAERYSGNFHPGIRHVATDRTDIFGSYTPQVFGPDQVATSCLLYNPTLANSNPGSRAGDFMHEGWHGWNKRWGFNGGGGSCGHFTGPRGNCSMSPCGCDYFYFHPISRYAFGSMWFQNGTATFFHSPTQVQVEFLCDVADYPKWWVPNSVRLASAADANARSAARFINGPGYRCGDYRPW